MRVIITGGGEVAYFLARTFLSKGYNVSIINNSPDECDRFSKRLKALVIRGDGSDPNILEDAKARESQILIAVTPHDHINMVCCQTADLLFKIPRTLALVNDPDNYHVFRELGIDHVFNQTDLIVSMIEKSVKFENVANLLEYEEGGVLINEVTVSNRMPALGKAIGGLDLPRGAEIIGLTRNRVFFTDNAEMVLKENDKVLLLTNPGNHGSALRSICGDEA